MKQKHATFTPLAGGRYRCNWSGCKARPLKKSATERHRRSHDPPRARPLRRARSAYGWVDCPHCGQNNRSRADGEVRCQNPRCGERFIAYAYA